MKSSLQGIRAVFWALLIGAMALSMACTKSNESKSAKKELWIYTSLYKDTIADMTPILEKEFPGVKFKWYQAGSEDIATKVNAELMAGKVQADIIMASDRFWFQEMADKGHLHAYKSPQAEKVNASLKHPDGFYSTVSIPVMVLAYNEEAVSTKEAPRTFKEMATKKWKSKFTTGSPLASGTNFTTVAMLVDSYGWDFVKGLRSNETISEGGNSAVLRRIQNKERPVGWVLLENVLRFQGKDKRLKVVYPEDGVVLHTNVLAVTKKTGDRKLAEDFVDWMFGPKGQDMMVKYYMYSPLPDHKPPKGAKSFAQVSKKSFPWTKEFIEKTVKTRETIKEKFAEIMF